MARSTTPYEYGDIDLEAIGDGPPQEHRHGTDTVIVEGSAMSYRSYVKREPE